MPRVKQKAKICGGSGWNRTNDQGLMSPPRALKLLNKWPVSQIAEASNLSKAYISQVKHGKRPPSKKLLEALEPFDGGQEKRKREYLVLFLLSREANGASKGTLRYYGIKLGRFLAQVNPDKARQQDLERFLLQFDNAGNRHAHFRAIRTFYNWREQNYGLPSPMRHMRAPKLGKLIMPSLTREQVLLLLEKAPSLRDRAIIAIATESGLRLWASFLYQAYSHCYNPCSLQERSMARAMVMINCPETGTPVATGISMERVSFAPSILENQVLHNCPICGRDHFWSKEDAFLEEEHTVNLATFEGDCRQGSAFSWGETTST